MLFFIYGSDTFRSLQKLRELLAAYTQQNALIITLEGENFELPDFKNHLRTHSLFNEQKVIFIKNLIADKKFVHIDLLLPLLDAKPKSTEIVFYEREELDKKLSFVRQIRESDPQGAFHSFFEYKILNEREFSDWIQAELKKAQKTIDNDASFYIARACANSWQAYGEIQKLLAYPASRITKSIAEALIAPKIDDNIFHFIDALTMQNSAQAIRLLEEQFKSGSDTFYILTMVARQIKILIKIKSALETSLPQTSIAQNINEHPFVVSKALSTAKRISYTKLIALLNNILEIDKKLKTTSIPPEALLTKAVCNVVI